VELETAFGVFFPFFYGVFLIELYMFAEFLRPARSFPAFLLIALFFLAFAPSAVHAFGDLGIVVEKLENPEKETRCPICGRVVNPGPVHSDAAGVLKEELKTALTDSNVGYYDGTKRGQPYINLLVYRFQERKGGNFAVEKPASIGFHIHLMQDRVVGKVFVYSEEQKALTQNLFTMGKFLRRGARWVTVGELAREGIKTGLDELLEPKETTETESGE